jgi:hypothetical protein
MHVMHSWSLVTGEMLLWYPRKLYSYEILPSVLLFMLFVCSLQRDVWAKVIPRFFSFFEQETEWLNNLN